MSARLVYLVTEDWYFCSHRLALACAARAAGFDVTVLTQVTRDGGRIESAGLRLEPIRFSRSGTTPLADLGTLAAITRHYRRARPHLVHHVALKPVLYGSLAARWCPRVRVVNALTGLGYVFTSGDGGARRLRSALRPLLRALLARPGDALVLQNRDDEATLRADGILRPGQSVELIRGAGVDVVAYAPQPEPAAPVTVVLPARMLRDKGVVEFVAAARLLRGSGARFVLVGARDPQNPAGIPGAELDAWQRDGAIEWWGHRADMVAVYAAAHVVCLPSYREGLPKALLEAAASGRPLVATDVPGCREIVRPELTGLLVPPRDAAGLAAALRRLIEDAALRARLGAAARRAAVAEFAQEHVIAATLALYRRLLAGAPLHP